MAKDKGKPQETEQQRALAEVARAKLTDARERWQPLQRRAAQQIVAAGAEGSSARQHAAGQSNVDNAVRFSDARQALDAKAGATGSFGSSGHKLGLVGMGSDQATSRALGAVQADQAVDEATITGLGAVTALGRGEQAGAIAGLGRAADISGQIAAADAQASLDRRMGNAALVGRVAGLAASNYKGDGFGANGPGYSGTQAPAPVEDIYKR